MTDHDHMEYMIGKHRVAMTADQASLWNTQASLWNDSDSFRKEDYAGALIFLGNHWLPFDVAFESWTLMDEIEDERAIPAPFP